MSYIQDLGSPLDWRRKEAEKTGRKFESDAVVEDGVARWRANNRVPPADICALWEHLGKPFDPAATAAARKAETDAFLAEYRKNWRPPTGAALAEMRAEGLVGEVVDLAAGRRFQVPA